MTRQSLSSTGAIHDLKPEGLSRIDAIASFVHGFKLDVFVWKLEKKMDDSLHLTAYVRRDHASCRGSELMLKALEGQEHDVVEVDGRDPSRPWLRGTPLLVVQHDGMTTVFHPTKAFEYLGFDAQAYDMGPIDEEKTATEADIDAAIEARIQSGPRIGPDEQSHLRSGTARTV